MSPSSIPSRTGLHLLISKARQLLCRSEADWWWPSPSASKSFNKENNNNKKT